jgi:hypothetical protein
MSLTEGFTEIASSSSVGNAGQFAGTFILFVVGIMFVASIAMTVIALGKSARYNVSACVFMPTNSGLKRIRLRAGILPNKATGKPEFRLRKPKLVINNYNPEWIISTGRRGVKGAFDKDECFLVNTGLNKFEMLNPVLVREDGGAIAFVAKNIGKDRLSELMDNQIEELFTTENFLSKYGTQIFFGTLVFSNVLCVLMIIQLANKLGL